MRLPGRRDASAASASATGALASASATGAMGSASATGALASTSAMGSLVSAETGKVRKSYVPPRILGEFVQGCGSAVLQSSVSGDLAGTQTTGQGVDEYNAGPGGDFTVNWGE